MKKTEKSDKPAKRHYESPKLRALSLKAEEVLALGCKVLSGTSGPSSANCLLVPQGTPCINPGTS